MLYRRNNDEILKEELFRNPTSEYRGIPFWAWNCRLDKGMLRRQMDVIQEMGFGGFHIHSRTGLDVSYMSDEFMNYVKYCVEYANQNDILTWVYDEDRFPSGSAGGLVTKNKEFRCRELLLTTEERSEYLPSRPKERSTESYLIAKFDTILNVNGTLHSYKIIQDNEEVKGTIWYAYLHIKHDEAWFNYQTYVDTLYKPAIEEFCEVVYERYKEVVGEYFGGTIPSFFTDEPQTAYKKALGFANQKKDLTYPWTDNFPDTFFEKYKMNIIEHIPELVWELPDGKISEFRYYYHRHVAECFTECYVKTLSNWCKQNNVSLTGHLIKESSISSQSTGVGEIMLPLSFFDIPGIDILYDRREYVTVKQAQSIEHQFGREGVLSELYGGTNWDFDFRRHKLSGDWQAALGVTIRVPHLSLMSMQGESKRDYPASIHYQSPWYKEYSFIEDYFARMHTVMSRGKAIVKIGIIHPVESYWLYQGCEEHTSKIKQQINDNFQQLTEWLLYDHLDFDYIAESVLEDIGDVESGKLKVGEMQYDVCIVADCYTLRSATVLLLEKLEKQEGNIIFTGNIAAYVDAKPDYRVKELVKKVGFVLMDKQKITAALEKYRTVKIVNPNGGTNSNLLYQLRQDGELQWIFIAHGKSKERYDVENAENILIYIDGSYEPVLYDATCGDIRELQYEQKCGQTVIKYKFYVHDSLLIQLRPCNQGALFDVKKQIEIRGKNTLSKEISSIEDKCVSRPAVWKNMYDKVSVRLSEPNVYMLDIAEYAIDEMPFEQFEEVLRIGDAMRKKYGITPQSAEMAQPWATTKREPNHILKLRYTVESKIVVEQPMLALEHAENTLIIWNGEMVPSLVTGYYVDEKIKTVKLPAIKEGTNTLLLEIQFGEGTDVENSFLLGDFGVKVNGHLQEIIEPVKKLAFGDVVSQGLPFYGGNIEYELEVEADKEITVRVPYYRGALIGVSVDGERKDRIVYAPYQANLKVDSGKHKIGLTLFGNRINTFGALHNCDENCCCSDPNTWRTKGDSFSYEYQLKKIGILKRPDIC